MDAKLNFIAMLTHLSEGANIYNILYKKSESTLLYLRFYQMKRELELSFSNNSLHNFDIILSIIA